MRDDLRPSPEREANEAKADQEKRETVTLVGILGERPADSAWRTSLRFFALEVTDGVSQTRTGIGTVRTARDDNGHTRCGERPRPAATSNVGCGAAALVN